MLCIKRFNKRFAKTARIAEKNGIGSGFTIIEVMIVLSIMGLMLVGFMASAFGESYSGYICAGKSTVSYEMCI